MSSTTGQEEMVSSQAQPRLQCKALNHLGGTAGLGGLALAFPIAISDFVGWENSGALAEEAKNPRRDIPNYRVCLD
jgi:amino acid transporter